MNMLKENQNLELAAEQKSAINSWLNLAQSKSVADIVNPDLVSQTLEKALIGSKPFPLVLTLCPAIKNLDTIDNIRQTRTLVPLSKDNQRLRSFLLEILGFQISIKRSLGLETELFIVFADSLQKGSEQILTNPEEINQISQESIKAIREVIQNIDQSNPGVFQKLKIRIPKIRLQSAIEMQGGKIGFNRRQEIQKIETAVMDPNSIFFGLWLKHIQLARNDEKFSETSWQGLKSAEAIWLRMRFLIAELATDGIFLPEIMKHISKERLSNDPPEPIFIASSIRPATLQMEADCLNAAKPRSLIPAFSNIGRWLDKPIESPWIELFNTAIMS